MKQRLFPVVALWLLLTSGLDASSTLIFPRLSFAPGELTGIAVVNPGSETASVTFTAFISLPGLTNRVSFDILPGQQFARVTSSIFGPITDPEAIAWILAESESDDLTGFFQVLDTSLSFLDGADLPPLSSKLIFPDVRLDEGFSTKFFLVSPQRAVTVELTLVGPGSTVTKQVSIPNSRVFSGDVSEFFADAGPVGKVGSSAYLIAETRTINGAKLVPYDLAGFALVGKEGEDLLGFNARPASELLTTLLFPQMAVLDPFVTVATVGNFSDEATLVTLTAYQENGEIFADEVITNPVVVALDPGEILKADLAETFGFSGESVLEGWLKVESTSPSINGSVSYSLPSLGPIASVPSVARGSRRALFSHIGTSLGFFTGLATLNAGALAANVKVVASQANGEVLGTFTTTLQPGERRSELLTDIIPEAEGQAGGMIWVESDVPVYLTAIFGSLATGVFANVPPQPVPESFRPDAGIDQLEVTPSLVVLSPGQAQQFQLTQAAAAPAGAPVWRVNGEPGGTPDTGVISADGLYTAPAEIPSALPVTVTGRADEQLAGASVDIQQKEIFLPGPGHTRALAYQEESGRLFTVETTNSEGPAERGVQGPVESTIFDVTTGTPEPVAVFEEDISDMVPWQAEGDKEYLLLAGKTSGTVRRLDPETGVSVEVATGLNGPKSLAFDPATGDLLVAEADRISTVPAAALQEGPAPADLETPLLPRNGIAEDLSATDMVVDRCTGNVYVSQAATGQIVEIDRRTCQESIVRTLLLDPGQMLGLYRSDISCPDSFHLLVAESVESAQTTDKNGQITLFAPATGITAGWSTTPGMEVSAIALLPEENPLESSSVLIAETASQSAGQISRIEIEGRYKGQTINPPPTTQLISIVLDPNLEGKIRQLVGLFGPTPITCQWARGWTGLSVRAAGIESLKGLEAFFNLEFLAADYNEISDLGPLAALTKLETLEFGSNQVSDLGPLADLTQMTRLNLLSNQISDLTPLAALVKLEALYLRGNLLSSETDFGPLAGMSMLRGLWLGEQDPLVQIGDADLSPLAGLAGLVTLEISRTGISDLGFMAGLTELKVLYLTGNQISDLTPLSALTGLTDLRLGLNQISDLGPLSGLAQIPELKLDSNQISDLTPLSALTGLTDLRLGLNQISDLSPLSGLAELSGLGLESNQISDLAPLVDLESLRALLLENNQINDLSPLSDLQQLHTLRLDNNQITDINALVMNPGIGSGDTISLHSNPLDAGDCPDLQILVNRGANVLHDVNCQ